MSCISQAHRLLSFSRNFIGVFYVYIPQRHHSHTHPNFPVPEPFLNYFLSRQTATQEGDTFYLPRCLIEECYRRICSGQIRFLTLYVTVTSLNIFFSCLSICCFNLNGSSVRCIFLRVLLFLSEICSDSMSRWYGVWGVSYFFRYLLLILFFSRSFIVGQKWF